MEEAASGGVALYVDCRLTLMPRFDRSLLEIARASGKVPEQKPRAPAHAWEHHDHSILVQWIQADKFWSDVVWWATPNQGRRTKRAQAQLKREGMRAGVPDLQFMLPLHGWHGLFLELKAPPPHSWEWSKHQRDLAHRLARAGYAAIIARGEFAARDAMEAYRTGRLRDVASGVGGFWWRVDP